ncbi:MAG TPA: patatin-like phospholipase family protein, partial [Bacteroidia bacterium]|nr:patatin-like phospholipase family protein [Bacteroidia bacterium]
MAGKKALVLSGGSVKGCWQAGAIKAVFESGFAPDIIYGISVGTLNGAFLTNQAGNIFKTKGSLTTADWITIAGSLQDFWFNKITGPDSIVLKRSVIGDAISGLFKNFKGLTDTAPINKIIDTDLDVANMVQAPLKFVVGTVDFVSGNMIYASPGDTDFISYVKGSIAIPIAMPPWESAKKEVLFDGGTRDVAPLGKAINDGANNIIGIVCQAMQLAPDSTFSPGDLMQLTGRVEDIIVNQNVQNDSEWIQFINSVVAEA